jgi:hypothetical protein
MPKPSSPSWRDVLPIHPAADLFDPLPPDELRVLGEDILKNGLTCPVALWLASPEAQAQLLDGRNRLDAIEAVTGQPVQIVSEPIIPGGSPYWLIKAGDRRWGSVIELRAPTTDPYTYVTSANVHRRHLTAEQKRGVITALIKADPTKSDRSIADTVQVDHKTVGAVRAEQEACGEIPHTEKRTDTTGRQQRAHRAPSKAKPGTRAIKFTPELIGQIKDLIKRGTSQEKIAETIGVTVGSLQVTCSRLGISLRPPPTKAKTGQPTTENRDDIGPDSGGEIERKLARLEELETENVRLRRENDALRSEVEELQARLAAQPPSTARNRE